MGLGGAPIFPLHNKFWMRQPFHSHVCFMMAVFQNTDIQVQKCFCQCFTCKRRAVRDKKPPFPFQIEQGFAICLFLAQCYFFPCYATETCQSPYFMRYQVISSVMIGTQLAQAFSPLSSDSSHLAKSKQAKLKKMTTEKVKVH